MLFEGGGNYPAAAVPLVALGTQSGIIDVVDVSANAVTSSLSVHNGIVRGLRWLGNSRLVSFSYTQVYNLILLVMHFISLVPTQFISLCWARFCVVYDLCISFIAYIIFHTSGKHLCFLFHHYAYAFGLRLMKNPEDILTS
jgi:hypothetical protein